MELTLTNITEIPPFLRFNNVKLWYRPGTRVLGLQHIEKKCELFNVQLLPLKSALNGSNMVEFLPHIPLNDPNYFTNHLQLLDYFQNRLISICDSAHAYKFTIPCFLNANDIANVILSILQMSPIKRCSNVQIVSNCLGVQNQLPVEVISNWLEKTVDGMEINYRKFKEIILKIRMSGIQNTQEIIDNLKMV